tara:strand:+ start:153 stop:302 length:150 start_codon:yes stop_codon:yes gene_type:complete
MTKKQKQQFKTRVAGMRSEILKVRKILAGFPEKMEALHIELTDLIEKGK